MEYHYNIERGLRFTNAKGEMSYHFLENVGIKRKRLEKFKKRSERRIKSYVNKIKFIHTDELDKKIKTLYPIKIEIFETESRYVETWGEINYTDHKVSRVFEANAILTAYPFGRFDFKMSGSGYTRYNNGDEHGNRPCEFMYKRVTGIGRSDCSTQVNSKERNLVKPTMLKDIRKCVIPRHYLDSRSYYGYINPIDFEPIEQDENLTVFRDVSKYFKLKRWKSGQ